MVMICLGGGISLLVCGLDSVPPRWLARFLNSLMVVGAMFAIPWGIAFWIKYGSTPIGDVLALPTPHPSGWIYLVWLALKVVGVVVLVQVIDAKMDDAGRGAFLRLLVRTLLILGLGLIPLPHVFESAWGEMIASAAPSTVVDGIIDILKKGSTWIPAAAGASLMIFTLPAVPGVYAAYYAATNSTASAALVSATYLTILCRYYYIGMAIGEIEVVE